MNRHSHSKVGTIGAVVITLLPQLSLAQPERSPCPDVDAAALAADHAACWFERHRRAEPDCAVDHDDRCLAQAGDWCEEAALDDPRVANACFMTAVHAGRLVDAAEVAEYLSAPTAEVARCRDAVVDMQTGRVITNPRGGRVTLDGRSYGPAPVELQLPSPWWDRRITVHFGAGETSVTREQLLAAFDRRSCRLSDIVVEGPPSDIGTEETEPHALDDLDENVSPAAPPRRGALTAVGWTLVGAGTTSAVSALATGLRADRIHGDLTERCSPTPCGSGEGGDISHGSALARSSTALTFVAGGLTAAGVVVLVVNRARGRERDDAMSQSRVRFAPGPAALGLGLERGF